MNGKIQTINTKMNYLVFSACVLIDVFNKIDSNRGKENFESMHSRLTPKYHKVKSNNINVHTFLVKQFDKNFSSSTILSNVANHLHSA